jgi:hypothetical protein
MPARKHAADSVVLTTLCISLLSLLAGCASREPSLPPKVHVLGTFTKIPTRPGNAVFIVQCGRSLEGGTVRPGRYRVDLKGAAFLRESNPPAPDRGHVENITFADWHFDATHPVESGRRTWVVNTFRDGVPGSVEVADSSSPGDLVC